MADTLYFTLIVSKTPPTALPDDTLFNIHFSLEVDELRALQMDEFCNRYALPMTDALFKRVKSTNAIMGVTEH